MKKFRSALIAALTTTAVFIPAAHAQEMGGMYSSPYFRLDTGYSWGTDNSVNSNSMVYGAGVGANLNPWIRGDLTVDYRGWYKANQNSSFAGAPLSGTDDVHSLAEMANLYWDIGHYNLTNGPFGQLTPYIGGGVGVAENQTNGYGTTTGGIPSGSVGGHTHTDFAWQVGAGTAISLAQNLSFDVGYRYVDLGRAETSEDGTFAGAGVTGVRSTENLRANEIHGGLRLNF